MQIEIGTIVKLIKDERPWKVAFLRGEDKPATSFREIGLREPEGEWRMAVVRYSFVEKVLG